MKRIAAVVLCLLAFGAACAKTNSAAAATVNGTKIPTSDLVDELNAIQANPDFISSLEKGAPSQTGASTSGLTVVGATPGSFDAAFVSQVLLREIDYTIVHTEFVHRNIKVNDACRLEAKNDVLNNLGNADAGAGEQLFKKFPQQYQDLLVRRNTEVIALDAALNGQECGAGPDAQGYFTTHPDEFTKLCVAVIVVNDQPTADSVAAQVRGGADFSALAKQVSVDTASRDAGGDVGCHLPSEYPQAIVSVLQAAQAGDILDPIPGQNGVIVIKLLSRQPSTLDEVKTQAEELASANAGRSLGTWLRQARVQAQVTVDARYGTFDPATFQINPPTVEVNQSSSPLSSASDSP